MFIYCAKPAPPSSQPLPAQCIAIVCQLTSLLASPSTAFLLRFVSFAVLALSPHPHSCSSCCCCCIPLDFPVLACFMNHPNGGNNSSSSSRDRCHIRSRDDNGDPSNTHIVVLGVVVVAARLTLNGAKQQQRERVKERKRERGKE